jgi:fused signal recognition particle receptor
MTEEKTKKRGLFSRLFRSEKEPEAAAKESPEEAPQEAPEAAAGEAHKEDIIEAAVEASQVELEEAPEEAPQEEPEEIPDETGVQDEIEEGPAPEPEAEVLADLPEERESAFSRLRRGLSKTRSGFVRSLDMLMLTRKQLDDDMVARLEEILVTADIGVRTAYELLESVTDRIRRRELDKPELVMGHLRNVALEILQEVESPLSLGTDHVPFVLMAVGVNGSGKTTTLAKIAARHKAAGISVLMAAGDTFRAAAVEQMEVWGQRIGCPVVRGKDKADPSSVIFEALDRAQSEGIQLVLVDTAGRLHTRIPLMEQLKKIRRTIERKTPGGPHETLLVIDSSNGQNAILQARTFNEAIPVTGIALTKLDGTSKGGVLVGISNELKIPVRYIGIGEKVDDLRDFNAKDFVEALFGHTDLTDDGH